MNRRLKTGIAAWSVVHSFCQIRFLCFRKGYQVWLYTEDEMVKSSDIARGLQAVEQDRIREAVRRHEAEGRSVLKNEVLPRTGIIGFLAGWTIMSLFDKDRR